MGDGASQPTVRVSAVLPVRDPGPGLAATLDALRATLSLADELVVVDDGSTDGTADLLRATDWQGLRTTVVSPTVHRGVAGARNLGLSQARGEMIWFVDWDDRWDTGIVETLYAARVASGAPVVGCGADLVDPRGKRRELLGVVRRPILLTGGHIGLAILDGRIRGYLWNKLFAREVLGTAPFPEQRTRSDFAGSVEVMARQATTYLLPDVLFHHVQRPGSLTTGQHPPLATLQESLRIGERVAELARVHPVGPVQDVVVDAALRRFRYREWHLAVAGTAMRAGFDPRTRQAYLRAALDGTRWRDPARILWRDPVLAARAAVLVGSGDRYPAVYRSYLTLRSVLGRLSRGGGTP
ncbi:glycosyltransferase family 2 protein [Ornithinimicrobium cerasi]|uniref:glycosyltransferase family 2 protein n=1 Tax=Ornithinimicrobium cerasi TaxID=2248773 RepID=UPI00137B72E9|nr:glycosyltransferase family A protein [Ornithinimicrobium cerasi]